MGGFVSDSKSLAFNIASILAEHKAGDVVEVTTPGGLLKLKITSIGK